MIQAAYGLSLVVETNSEGEVTPTVPITWSISEELVSRLQKKGFVNPYLLIAVASKTVYNQAGISFDEFSVTQVRLAKLETRREYVSFSRPHDNSVFAFVVDLNSRDAVKKYEGAKSDPDRIKISNDGDSARYGYADVIGGLKKFSRVDVSVPRELFAPEPPRALQALVDQFYGFSPFDQCDFRRRAILSILATPFVQFYGLFARLLTLIIGVFIMGRRPRWRSFFAFNPHDFAHDLSYTSFYDTYPDGSGRKWIWHWINPYMIGLYCFVVLVAAFLLVIVPGIVFAVWQSILGKGHPIPLTPWGYVFVGAAIDGFIAAVLGVVAVIAAVHDGSLNPSEFAARIKVWLQVRPGNTVAGSYRWAPQYASGSTATDSTIHLRFQAVKAKVCRPFAR